MSLTSYLTPITMSAADFLTFSFTTTLYETPCRLIHAHFTAHLRTDIP